MKIFEKGKLDKVKSWGDYKKKTITQVARIKGPFEVITREGKLMCPDGWLALDTQGWPYPIAAEEFDAIYEKIEEEIKCKSDGSCGRVDCMHNGR
uniref:Uncharacterized protein n=1 Tax=viral metagenome TaxID=1070528 RepID=A0A6M3JWI5_9ZZZZ